ncbi:MAG TPA: DMT family transporter [Caulobacteraceae bacterium]|nr:DMT family transporter [Caulobacteraceae bacterium]
MDKSRSGRDRLPANVQGALWILGSAVAFTAMTTLVKFLGEDYPASLQTFYRQASGVIVLAPWILRDPVKAFKTTRPGILLFRASAGTLAMILSFIAYQKLPLADANALSFTRALWLVPLAGLLLGEKIGPGRIVAVVVGFAGVLLMLRSLSQPGHAAIGWPQLAALASAALFAFTIAGMKVVMRDNTALVVLTWSSVLGLVAAIPPALFAWRWPTWPDLGLLAAMGAFAVVTQACYTKGVQLGDAAAIAPIDYTRLVFAAITGFVFFKEVPGMLTIAGAAIVVAASLFITWREAVLYRSPREDPTVEA